MHWILKTEYLQSEARKGVLLSGAIQNAQQRRKGSSFPSAVKILMVCMIRDWYCWKRV
ncbi:MAG: hypothetical protein JNL59_11650 [Chitinophagaceae bacterium]|nr:hypothetical protein [Chitinophagaceae bacterium]